MYSMRHLITNADSETQTGDCSVCGAERTRLRIDVDTSGIQYVVMSYNTPILWVTYSGWVYKVKMELTQTSRSHMELMGMLGEGYDRRLIYHPKR